MNIESRETMRQFLRACQANGHESVTVNGREIPLNTEVSVQEILEEIEQAPEDVQAFLLEQARQELPGLLRQNAFHLAMQQGRLKAQAT